MKTVRWDLQHWIKMNDIENIANGMRDDDDEFKNRSVWDGLDVEHDAKEFFGTDDTGACKCTKTEYDAFVAGYQKACDFYDKNWF